MKCPRHLLLFLLIIVICLSSSCATNHPGKEECVKALEQLPNYCSYAWWYRCSDMVKCVNTLRHAGKPQALAALTEYAQKHHDEPQTDGKLHWVCRLLFINPNGWRKLGGFGSHDPQTFDENVEGGSLYFHLLSPMACRSSSVTEDIPLTGFLLRTFMAHMILCFVAIFKWSQLICRQNIFTRPRQNWLRASCSKNSTQKQMDDSNDG